MTANTEIHGILAYPVTPFTADQQIDTGKLAALVERLVASGAHGIVPLGSTGESAYLTEAEFDAVIDTTIGVVDRRVPVIIGASDLTTANTIRRARYAERSGADAVMVLPISYWKLSEREIAQHYAAIGAAIGIPIMVYNNPATSGIDMRPELLVQMFKDIDNVAMVKE
nr:dihydrodipicolinate synthase family protein [Streptomyces sp. DSM 41633]